MMAYAETSKQSATPVSVSGKKSTDLPKGAVCTSVSITPSENGGYTVEHRYRAPAGKGKGDFPGYIEPKEYTFESKESMLKHVGTAFD
jgi:hypothetical protein